MSLPVCVVGGGPSAGGLDLNALRGRAVVVAINDCFKRLPWADVVFTADGRWLRSRINSQELRAFRGRVVAALPPDFDRSVSRRVERIERRPGIALTDDPRDHTYFADNSGFAGLTWAAAAFRRRRRFALIGFDLTAAGWWHAGYEWNVRSGREQYATWAAAFDLVAAGLAARDIDLVNINPQSAIRAYRFASFDAVLDGTAWPE